MSIIATLLVVELIIITFDNNNKLDIFVGKTKVNDFTKWLEDNNLISDENNYIF